MSSVGKGIRREGMIRTDFLLSFLEDSGEEAALVPFGEEAVLSEDSAEGVLGEEELAEAGKYSLTCQAGLAITELRPHMRTVAIRFIVGITTAA